MFRTEDYYPPEDKEVEEVKTTEDVQVLQTALVSKCPRCYEVCMTSMYWHAQRNN